MHPKDEDPKPDLKAKKQNKTAEIKCVTCKRHIGAKIRKHETKTKRLMQNVCRGWDDVRSL